MLSNKDTVTSTLTTPDSPTSQGQPHTFSQGQAVVTAVLVQFQAEGHRT
jgi:hypothetical protein